MVFNDRIMKRQTAIEAFGSVAKLAQALNMTRQAIYHWPLDLPLDYADRVRGAALRLGITLPTDEIVGASETALNQEAA